ncbi:phage tail-like protein [Streptomyces sp. SLBN-118]|uniref:phage tail protein n=1 Tax=Streptomyces sp. SLBN-118 TaxID=2768454 RepID=UPI00114D756A|nr:phage tail protein [Streptomyces sp. SLBN-118]TQK44155.1 phage tail-like protein [Streptomyces sp. SLBN-118]
MRAHVPELESPYPLGSQLPAIYADDGLTQRMTDAFDEVLAPVLSTLDNLTAYFAPFLAPADVLAWLAGWVGATIDVDWPLERQREAVACAVALHRRRGTPRGLAEQVEVVFGIAPEIEESGGACWSVAPGGPLPGQSQPRLTVRLRVPDSAPIDRRAVDRVVAANRPAHIPYVVEMERAEPHSPDEQPEGPRA